MTDVKPLVEIIRERIAQGVQMLPVFPEVALRLQQLLSRSDFDMGELAEVISEDQALTGQVLRMANSAFFAGLTKVATINDAIVRLGAQEVANLAMMASQANLYKSSNQFIDEQMKDLWRHALGCAYGARWLAARTGYESLRQYAFLAGLLHDIGMLFLLKLLDEIASEKGDGLHLPGPLVRDILDSMHVEQGYQLMKSWNLPDIYCTVVLEHEAEEFDQNNILLILVRLADRDCLKLGIGSREGETVDPFSCAETHLLGIREVTLAEMEIHIEDMLAQVLH
jgi:HD-like signal output (HDOD) protein